MRNDDQAHAQAPRQLVELDALRDRAYLAVAAKLGKVLAKRRIGAVNAARWSNGSVGQFSHALATVVRSARPACAASHSTEARDNGDDLAPSGLLRPPLEPP
jgi:hypothetical protein